MGEADDPEVGACPWDPAVRRSPVESLPSRRCRIVLRIARRERGRRFELRSFLGVGDRKKGGGIE